MGDIMVTPIEPVLRHEGVALWRQIATRLQQDIDAGFYPPGGRLPTEAELSQQFRVNRHTVRRALDELSRGGLVRVEQGRGSFVAEDVLAYAVEPRTRFSEWVRRHNKEPSGRLLALKEIAAEPQVASGLGIRAGSRVVLLERLG
ncbi:MAG TPA: GntR family transcriptional regulator, partial [Acetobacteraceae bacterium]